MTQYTRRLSDKILAAFHQACDQKQTDTAEYLLRALELAVTRYGGHPNADKRKSLAEVVDAYERLQILKKPDMALASVQ